MATCPNINLESWKNLVAARGENIAYYLWDKYAGNVPDDVFRLQQLEQKLIDGFLKDFNITVEEYEDLKNDLGVNGVTASDLVAKSIAYEKGESILPEVAYFAYSILGKQNNKLRSELRYLINKWDKYKERFKYHTDEVKKKEGYIKDSQVWKNKIRDLVILDFLKEKLVQHYMNPQQFEKSLDTKWTKEDFSLWNKIISILENLLSRYSTKYKNQKDKLSNIGIAIADEVLNQNYEYFNYGLKEDQFQKYYNQTINADPFAKELVEFGQKELGIVLTGSLALRKVGTVYRTADETLHDIDWVVPFELNSSDANISTLNNIERFQGRDKDASATMALSYVEDFDWFKKFKEKYSSYQLINGFYGAEDGDYGSITVQGVIDGEFYTENGYHEEEVSFYRKDPETKAPIKVKQIKRVAHKKGDWIKDTGYVIDFFIRLQPNQEQHENYFKVWKEIMIAKLQMGRDKDFSDWKAFVPYLKSRNSFNFNYEGFRHINYESSQNDAFEESPKEVAYRAADNVMLQKEERNVPEREQQSILFQLEEGPAPSEASPKAIKLIKDFLSRIGVDVKEYNNIVINGVKYNANAAANITQKLIQIVEGKEDAALPEEAMHFAVEIIQQKDPVLFKKLMSEINNYKETLDGVFTAYRNNPLYQTADGKPDVLKLKKEAIGKVLAQVIIDKVGGASSTESAANIARIEGWWNKILNFLKNLFSKSGFNKLSMKIIKGEDIGTADDIVDGTDAYLQMDRQEYLFNSLKNTKNIVDKRGEEGYWLDGEKLRRVTDIVKGWYERVFENKDLTKTEFEQAVDDLRAEKGTFGHKDFENMYKVFVDEDGFLRDVPLEDDEYVSKLDPENRDMYDILKENFRRRLLTFASEAKGGRTRFLSEVIVVDRKRKIGGTIDFIAIQPNGEVNVLDWKFVALNLERTEDIPWYKVKSWRNQMDQYKLILQNEYGVKSKDFGQTRMIPIYAEYTDADYKNEELPILLSVQIGDVNVKNIEKDYLLPVGTLSEKTGIRKIDELIERLNVMYDKMSEKPAKSETEKIEKREQLNALFTAIRRLQMKGDIKPLLEQAKILNKQIEKTINTFNEKFKGKNPKLFSEDELNDYAKELQDAMDTLGKYVSLDRDLKSFFSHELSENEKELEKEVSKTADKARDYEADLNDILKDFVSEMIAGNEDMERNFLSPEKVIKGLTKWFGTTSTLQLRSIQLLFKKADRAFTYADYDTETENDRLSKIENDYNKWATSKGLNPKNYFDILVKKDKHELIDEFNSDFYQQLKKKTKEKDIAWILENIDAGEYIPFIEQKRQEEIERIENKHRVGTKEEIERQIAFEKRKANELYDVSNTGSVGWLLYDYIKKFPKREKWISEEWKTLNKPENAPAKVFYDYIKERNAEYKELGYLSNKYSDRIFLPFARKSLIEKVIMGGDIRIGEQFLRSVSVDEGEIGWGNMDPETGKPIDRVPKYFITEVEDPSRDLFRVMALYNAAAIKYKYVSDIEYQVRAIVAVEKNKKSIATSMFGNTVYKDDVLQENPDNSENSKLVEDMMKAIVYGQKYLQSETFDQLLFKLGSWGETLNKKLGFKIFPENLSDRQVSVNKAIDSLNNTFQLNTLGLNLLSATSNRFGGTAQSIINSGKYFTKSDYAAAELRMFANKLGGEDAKKILAAIEYFLPLTENYNAEVAKKLSVSKFNSQNLQDGLMILMRESDFAVQTANFIAYLQNAIVQDGTILNVREYVRSLPKYKDNRYSGTSEQRAKLEEEFEEDVKRLIDEKGVMKVAELVDNKLVIPGVDRKSDSVIETRRIVQKLTRDALGNLSSLEVRLINLNIFGKSLMIFKGWIPRLVDVRLGNMKYNVAADAYEWGRMRTVYRILSEDLLGSIKNLYNSLTANDKGIDFLKTLYEKKKYDYERDTGKELNMTQEEFIDLVRSNIQAQVLDLTILLTLFIMVSALKANMPDDDEDPAVKAQYRFIVKMADKLRDELLYFYNPTSLSSLLGSGIFPSLSLLDNAGKAFTNFFIENWALATGDEELAEDTKVIKYWMKTFPVTNQMAGYLPMFYPELSKDLGLKVQSNYGLR
jgi:hypothetical protein